MTHRLRIALAAAAALVVGCAPAQGDPAGSTMATTIAPIPSDHQLAVVNGAAISIVDVTNLHREFGDLTSDEIAGSVLLLVLNQLFFDEALSQFGVQPTEEQIATALDARTERFGSAERRDEVLAATNRTRARLQLQSQLDAIRNTVVRHLVTTEAEGFDIDLAYRQLLLTESTVCVRHIQVLTEEGFALVQSRVDAGEDFATVALENSLDPLVDRTDGGSGAAGDLGCRSPASTPFPEAAMEAAVGEYVGPVFSSVGTHLIEVYERTAPELDEVRAEVLEVGIETQGDGLFNTWATGVLQAADVTIEETFGTWGPLPETNGVPTVIPAGR